MSDYYQGNDIIVAVVTREPGALTIIIDKVVVFVLGRYDLKYEGTEEIVKDLINARIKLVKMDRGRASASGASAAATQPTESDRAGPPAPVPNVDVDGHRAPVTEAEPPLRTQAP